MIKMSLSLCLAYQSCLLFISQYQLILSDGIKITCIPAFKISIFTTFQDKAVYFYFKKPRISFKKHITLPLQTHL